MTDILTRPAADPAVVPLKLHWAGGLGPAEEGGRRGVFTVDGERLVVQVWTEAEWMQIPPGARPAGCGKMEPDGYYLIYVP
jgi:hypothetical protein